jgi:plasmid stabilization system protein ParE
VAAVRLARAAVDDLDRLIAVLSLPADTSDRIRRSLRPLEQFPLLGPELSGRWSRRRFLVGPWRWMLLVYEYRADDDLVVVVTIQDPRSSTAVTAGIE